MTVVRRFVPEDQAEFLPVTIRARDGESTDYVLVRPRVFYRCIDRERSDIRYAVEMGSLPPYISTYYELVLHEDCLEGRHMVRCEDLGFVVISDALRQALEEIGDPVFCPIDPKDEWRRHRVWRDKDDGQ